MNPIVSEKTMMARFDNFINPIIVLVISLIGFVFANQFEIYEGGADNYIHYRVSRYCYTYPGLFLDHWGKPVFTLFSSPFAQFGFKGMVFFNILCGVLASFFSWKVAEKLSLRHSWIALVLTLTMPVYFIMMASAMTEVFFSFVLILGIYLFLSEKFIVSAILFSSLFLIRNEGYIMYPFIVVALAGKKQWKSIPFLFTLPLFYSIIGFFYFGDFFWLINQMPYGDSSELYGTGELFFFVRQYKLVFGLWTSILIFCGGCIAAWYFIKKFFQERKIEPGFLLIECLALVYFAAHSYVWWSGTGASAGLIRVMAAIIPLAAVTAVRSIDKISLLTFLNSKISSAFVFLFSIYLLFVPFLTWPLPLKSGEREKTIAASVNWYKQSKYKDTKVYFYEPSIYFLLARDPFDHTIIKELIDDREHPEKVTKPREVIFYDTHFGPNEGALPLENLMNNDHFKLINYFEPLIPFEVLGNNYAIYIFERTEPSSQNNIFRLEKFIKSKTVIHPWKHDIVVNKIITPDEFTPLIDLNIDEINDLAGHQWINSIIETNQEPGEVLLVISIEKNGNPVVYQAAQLNESGVTQLKADISGGIQGNEKLKIYIWNKSRIKGLVKKLDVDLIAKKY